MCQTTKCCHPDIIKNMLPPPDWAWAHSWVGVTFIFFLSGYTHNIFLSFLFPAGHVDVLQLLEVSEKMEGVSLDTGLCTSRTEMEGKDLAYKIDKKVQLSVPTKQLFPGNTTTVVIYACIKLNICIPKAKPWKTSSSMSQISFPNYPKRNSLLRASAASLVSVEIVCDMRFKEIAPLLADLHSFHVRIISDIYLKTSHNQEWCWRAMKGSRWPHFTIDGVEMRRYKEDIQQTIYRTLLELWIQGSSLMQE